LPETVHLLDLLGLEPRSSDAVLRRWQATGPIPRCAAPIGATAEGTLSIDWVEDGPHGLLAGTTGAGKSELLRSLVASLAATVDPEHLNFILIDYKGGSAFDACAGLPHTVGMVTDLDGHLAHRALTCLEAELRHREEVLRAATADNIHDYHALGAAEPMPRLLVVIDEFAALAKELPDFMASLVDVAQRGRSLGVHLLLATQRPNGVISDAIRANTNLRLSLRVQDVADSTDVIGTGDAAQLARSRPGRGFLRRGPGDIVAFQSALVTGTSGGAAAAIAVRPFELLPSAAPAPAGDGAAQTDLDVLVSIVQQAARKAGFAAPRLLWPEPLPAEVTLAAAAAEPGAAVLHPDEVVIGLADEPHRQRRRPFSWSIGGSLFFYGVQGSGTSSALRAAIVAACGKFSVDELHVYAIDFDDQSLGALERLPQVGAVIGAGERARQIRLLRYLQREVAERRERVATDPAALEGLPRIVVAVDNYAGFRAAFEDPSDMAIKESLGRIVADGPGVGIVVLATAKQPIDIPTTVASLVPSKLVFTLADRYEYAGLGVAAAEPTAVAGRAFESGTSLEVQLARVGTADVLAVEAATEPATLSQATPWSIELLPAEVKIPDIAGSGAVFDLEWKVPVGLGDDRLQPVGWTIREGDHVLISGPARSGKSTALVSIATILRGARSDMLITGLVSRRSPLLDTPEIGRLVADPAELAASLADVAPGVPHAILIDDAEDIDDAAGILVGLLAERTPHRHCFVAGSGDILRTAYGHWTQSVRRSRLGMALSPTGQGDGDLWQVALPRNMPVVFPAGRGYLIADGTAELAQVAWQ
jgi:S-DNA-T family DNA segregation ATPase FtsK/SpoIIIE